jgi:hypothetical protein
MKGVGGIGAPGVAATMLAAGRAEACGHEDATKHFFTRARMDLRRRFDHIPPAAL